MRIGAVGMGFQPYIYNTNTVSSSSLNKVAPIEDDALKSSVDYSSSRNQNRLRMGQTANFADVLAMQMQIGQNNATRIMKPAAKQQEMASVQTEQPAQDQAELSGQSVQDQAEFTGHKAQAGQSSTESAMTLGGQDLSQSGVSPYMMNRAIDAYTMALAG